MKSKIYKNIKSALLLYCVLFTVTTLGDNIWQLTQGHLADSNYHIINRAVVVLIAVISITLFDKLHFINKLLSNVISYILSMGTVLTYVWITSFWDELSPGAYQGVFITFTALSIFISIIIYIKDRIKAKKIKCVD